MSLDQFLFHRKKSQNWQLRVMVPKAVRPVLGRAEFVRSLGVTDRRQAEALAYPLLAEWKAKIAAAARSPANVFQLPAAPMYAPTAVELEEVALFVGYEEAGRRVNELIKAKAQSGDEAYRALGTEFERRHTDALRRLHAEDHAYWIERARQQVAKRDWHLPEGSVAFTGFVDAMAVCGVDLFASAKAKLTGNEGAYVPSPPVRKALEARQERAKPGEGVLRPI